MPYWIADYFSVYMRQKICTKQSSVNIFNEIETKKNQFICGILWLHWYYIQIVFAVKNRNSLISTSWDEKLYKYISDIISEKGQKPITINGMPDHIHIFIGMKPSCCLSDLVREI